MTIDKTTPDELRDEMMSVFRVVAQHWADLPDVDPVTGREMTNKKRCEGVVHSILTQLDGMGSLPAFSLVSSMYPDEDQSRDSIVIDDMLHEYF